MDSTASGPYAKLVVNIKSAHNLMDPTWLGKADPYAVLKVAGAEIQTHHIKNAGENATWDETFAFNNVAMNDILELSVYDHNKVLKDGLMGTGTLELREVFEEGRLETRLPLSNRTGTKDAGEVWLTIRSEGLSTSAVAESAGLEGQFQPMKGAQEGAAIDAAADTQGEDSGEAKLGAGGAQDTGPETAAVEARAAEREEDRIGDRVLEHLGVKEPLVQDKAVTGEDAAKETQ